jgi:tRNA modification GTPase
LREGADEAETIGIAKSREALADANLVLVVVESGVPLSDEERGLLETLRGRHVMLVRNKCDLELEGVSGEYVTEAVADVPAVRTSAITGEGMDALRGALLELVKGAGDGSETGMLTTLRHHEAVKGALAGLAKARGAAESGIPHEMVLLDLYEALRQLDSLTGETTADDILNLIFSSFCIGK